MIQGEGQVKRSPSPANTDEQGIVKGERLYNKKKKMEKKIL